MAQFDLKAVILAEDRSAGALKSFSHGVSSIGEGIASISQKLLKFGAVAISALGAAGTAATAFAVKGAADFEQTRIGLENMLGSADAAKKILSDVSKFAAETPFEFPELADTVRQLVAFGFSGDEAMTTMKQLGDVSAAVGAPIGDLAYLMGTLKTQGRAMTIDIRQFAQRGIPIYEYLTKVVGKSGEALKEMIEEGKIGFPEVAKAFELMTAAGGKFHATMAKQSRSLSGLWSTLKDNFGFMAREIIGISISGDVRENSIFDYLRRGAARLIEFLANNQGQIIKFAQGMIDKFIFMAFKAIDFMRAIKELATGGSLNEFYEKLNNIFGDYISYKIQVVIYYFQKAYEGLMRFLNAIGAPAAFNAFISYLVTTYEKLGGIQGILNSIGISFGKFTTWIINTTSSIKQFFTETAIGQAILQFFKTVIDMIWSSLQILWAEIMRNKEEWKLLGMVLLGISAFISGMMLVALLALINMITAVVWVIARAIDLLKALWNLMVSGVSAALPHFQKGIYYSVIRPIQDTVNSIKNLMGWFDSLKNKASNVMNSISGSSVGKFFGNIFRAQGGPVSSGNPYIVGEQGPELFVPNQSGTIIPNDKMGSQITVNFYGNLNNTQAMSVDQAGQAVARQIELAMRGAM